MFRNYLLTAWRNLVQQRVYSLINLLGLALGITCCLLISLYVQHELAYDDYHEHADGFTASLQRYDGREIWTTMP